MIQFCSNDVKGTIKITKVEDNSFCIHDFAVKHSKKILESQIDRLPYILTIKKPHLFDIITELSLYNLNL